MPATASVAQPSASISARNQAAVVVAEVRRIIREEYVLPERRPALDAVLAEGLNSGRYRVTDPALLADRITADLTRVGNDHHLNFRYDPKRVAAMTAGDARGQAGPDRGPPLAMVEAARRANHGIRELKILPGNIRYLELAGFDWTGEESEKAINSAMEFLKDGDAVIIDLRRNGGGSGRAVHQVISHFLQADKPLITFYKGAEASPTMRSLPGLSKLQGKPLYVLTSRATGSAAEEFVGHVAGYKLGEVVGTATSGAAYMNAVFPVDGRFELSVSVARPVLASTGKDWERTGIAPTIPASVEAALQVAHMHAAQKLAVTGEQARRAGYAGLAAGLDAISRPKSPAAPLKLYPGRYGSDRRVVLESGRLWYHQEERPRRPMVSLGGHTFTLEDDPSLRITFEAVAGRIAAMAIGPAGGPVLGRYEVAK